MDIFRDREDVSDDEKAALQIKLFTDFKNIIYRELKLNHERLKNEEILSDFQTFEKNEKTIVYTGVAEPRWLKMARITHLNAAIFLPLQTLLQFQK